jgi:hypothetical protein
VAPDVVPAEARGFGHGPTAYVPGVFPTPHGGGIPPAPPPHSGGFPHGGGNHGGYQQDPTQPRAYIPLSVLHGGQPQNPTQYRSLASTPGYVHDHQQPYSNLKKQFANWNICYSCGFDVADAHISMSCHAHLRKASHDIYFTHQNAQQYINLGHPCSTKNRHKTQFLAM